jgi:hypothetical protein
MSFGTPRCYRVRLWFRTEHRCPASIEAALLKALKVVVHRRRPMLLNISCSPLTLIHLVSFLILVARFVTIDECFLTASHACTIC